MPPVLQPNHSQPTHCLGSASHAVRATFKADGTTLPPDTHPTLRLPPHRTQHPPLPTAKQSQHTIEGEHTRSLRPHHSSHSHLRVRCDQRRRCAEQALRRRRRGPGRCATVDIHNSMPCRCEAIHTKVQPRDRHRRTTRCCCIDRDLVAHHRCCTMHLAQSPTTNHTCPWFLLICPCTQQSLSFWIASHALPQPPLHRQPGSVPPHLLAPKSVPSKVNPTTDSVPTTALTVTLARVALA